MLDHLRNNYLFHLFIKLSLQLKVNPKKIKIVSIVHNSIIKQAGAELCQAQDKFDLLPDWVLSLAFQPEQTPEPNFVLNICSNYVRIKYHIENQLPSLLNSGHNSLQIEFGR